MDESPHTWPRQRISLSGEFYIWKRHIQHATKTKEEKWLIRVWVGEHGSSPTCLVLCKSSDLNIRASLPLKFTYLSKSHSIWKFNVSKIARCLTSNVLLLKFYWCENSPRTDPFSFYNSSSILWNKNILFGTLSQLWEPMWHKTKK